MLDRLVPTLLIFLLVSWNANPSLAQENDLAAPAILQPAPRLMPQGYYPPVFPAIPPQMPRPGTREVWQYMGVTQTGRWRPKVILSPYGSYYYYSGEPYPWITNRATAYMPYALD